MSQRERETGVGDDITEERRDSDDVTGKMMSQEERQVMSDSKTDGLL